MNCSLHFFKGLFFCLLDFLVSHVYFLHIREAFMHYSTNLLLIIKKNKKKSNVCVL